MRRGEVKRETERETERQRERDRETDRQRDRQADIQRHKEADLGGRGAQEMTADRLVFVCERVSNIGHHPTQCGRKEI